MPIQGQLIRKLKGVGAEIGVWYGEGVEHILSQCADVHHIYCIDPYEKAQEFKDCILKPQGFEVNGFGDAKIKAINRNMRHSEKAWFIFARSTEAAKYITEKLDFVYIDANHNYEYAKEDIETWWPKLKKGGILSGHDYPSSPGVAQAVNEFVGKHKLDLVETAPDWYCYKP